MKILLVNKFYYPRGGDCISVFNTEALLRSKGHRTAVFSVAHPQNRPSEMERFFPAMIDFAAPSWQEKAKAAARLFGFGGVVDNFKRLLEEFRPDVVHLNNIHSYLSPVIAQIAHRRGIRTVWTLHDYKLICPAYACRNNDKPCEMCFAQKSFDPFGAISKSPVIKYRCMKGSLAASLMAWFESVYWNRQRLQKYTDCFISPSRFLKEKMITAGFNPSKIDVLHNFDSFNHREITSSLLSPKQHYYCYVGRLSGEKGVYSLLKAANELPYKLIIVGDGPLLTSYRNEFESSKIEFTGRLKPEKVLPIIEHARLLVMPSVCYENNPLGIIEALSAGTPVLGANIGGIPELIEENVNGMLFPSGNIPSLRNKIVECFSYFNDSYNFKKIAADAQSKFSKESFYDRLITIYE